jgi:hypothetical protein
MKTAVKMFTVSLISMVSAGAAIAQDAPAPAEGEPASAEGAATEAGAAVDGAATDAAATMTDAAAEMPMGGRWSRSVIDRPLTLPKGLISAGLDIVNSTSSFFDPALIGIVAGYGVSDDLEISPIQYAFSTKDAGKGDLTAGAGYKLLRGAAGGKLEVIGRAAINYDLAFKGLDLALGAQAQYNVTPKIAVYTPGGQLRQGIIASETIVAGMTIKGDNVTSLTLPIGVGFQATPELWVQADTNLGNIKIANGPDSAFIFSKNNTPLNIIGTYSVMPALDVNAGVGLNVTADKVGDSLTVLVGARYYVGQL